MELEMLIEVGDPEREAVGIFEWNPGRKLIKAIRFYQKLAKKSSIFFRLIRSFAVIRCRFWLVISGADIPLNTKLGEGLILPHPNGVVLHPDVTMGPNCMILQQVTIGAREGSNGVPNLGIHVDVGAGAKIFGKITIDDYAVIGANAVVIQDVPRGAIVAGVPAKVIRIRDDV
jgi:serine O-acetyltransferase